MFSIARAITTGRRSIGHEPATAILEAATNAALSALTESTVAKGRRLVSESVSHADELGGVLTTLTALLLKVHL